MERQGTQQKQDFFGVQISEAPCFLFRTPALWRRGRCLVSGVCLSVLDEPIGQRASKLTRQYGMHQRSQNVQHRSWITKIRTKEGGG